VNFLIHQQLRKGSLVDSVGKQIEIGAALYLPDNFDSLSFIIHDGDNAIIDTVVRSFKDGYFYDTIWIKQTFWTPGIRNLTITPYTTPVRPAIVTSITIKGLALNAVPKWTIDTLNKTVKVGTQLSLELSEICSDPNENKITYTLTPGAPENDSIIGTTYLFTPTIHNAGSYNVQIKASDSESSFSILPINIKVDTSAGDKTPPEIAFIVPLDTNSAIVVDSFTIDLLCKDSSGVASVSAVLGTTTFQSNFKDGHYLILVKGFTKGTTNIVTVNAKDSSALENTKTRRIYVNYLASTYTVAYQKGAGGSGDVPVDTKKYQTGEQITVLGNNGNLTKSGCTFSGWNTQENGSGAAYTGGTTLKMGYENVVLYAQWTTNSTFKVVYNANGNTGGAVPVDSNSYNVNATVTLKGNTGLLVKTGNGFAGWNTAADGSGTTYAVGATFSMGNANITLYAVWKSQSTFTVTYNGNANTAGAAPIDPGNYEPGTTITVRDNTGNMVKVGFTFAGWNTAADGSGIAFAAGSTFIIGTDVTLYARWTQHPTFTVTYSGNANTSGMVPVDVGNYEIDMTVTVKDNTGNMMKTGCTFVGWNTSSDGSGTAYAVGATIPMGNANITLYAQWTTKPTFTVNYNGNGSTAGTAPTDTSKYETSASVTLIGNTGSLSRAGFTFNGWNNLQDGTGKTYQPSDTLVIGTQNIQLYVKWDIDSFTVSFNSNGGNTIASKIVAYGGYVTEPAVPTRSGYVFAGWYSNQSLTTPFDFLTAVTISRTLYAKWNPVYVVIYNPNGANGQVPVDNNQYQSGQVITMLDKPTGLSRQYYDFSGWNTASNGTGITRLPGTTYQIGSKNDTLYANWQIARPVIIIQPSSLNSYPLDSVSFLVTAEGIGLTYQWQKDGVDLPGAINTIFSKKRVYYSDSGLYRCVVSNTGGNTISSYVRLIVRTSVKDADSNEYAIVVIGDQVWTTENLRTTKLNDGTSIPQVSGTSEWSKLSTPGYCFYENSTNYTEQKKWGAMYNWYTVNTGKLAPAGWHVPDTTEWFILASYIKANSIYGNIGKALASKTDWEPNTYSGTPGNDPESNNTSRLNILPAGTRNSGGDFWDKNWEGDLWTKTQADTSRAYLCGVNYASDNYLIKYNQHMRFGLGVRLIKN
jgi:uncharacterized protein (TIGR02145 family)/uncharacterized repeat protein (TIGR02543 family)